MESSALITVALPLALTFIMLGMGMSLVLDDFRRIVSYPKAALIGLTAQMFVLPLLCFVVVSAFEMDPLMAVGLLILSFCPGGTASNLMTFLVKGDLALSISLTAVVSLIAPFTIPFLANLSMAHFLGEGSEFALPLVETVLKLLAVTVVPVGVGMLLRQWKPQLCDRLDKTVKILSLAFLILIIVGITLANTDNIFYYLDQVGLAALTLNVSALMVGLGLAMALKLSRDQSVTIAYEVGLQNGTTALLVTGTILNNEVMSIAPAVYSFLMLLTGGLFGFALSFIFKKHDNKAL